MSLSTRFRRRPLIVTGLGLMIASPLISFAAIASIPHADNIIACPPGEEADETNGGACGAINPRDAIDAPTGETSQSSAGGPATSESCVEQDSIGQPGDVNPFGIQPIPCPKADTTVSSSP